MHFKHLSFLLPVAMVLSPLCVAQITNGDFENFSGNSPDGWTTIDSGISISPSSLAYSGSLSAAITVNTATQSSTDLRQSIEVVNGETYNFSAHIYHTEGNVRARLYVDGYQNYSEASLTGQWQQISYSYTASATESIEVGLRFYDQSGFDGSELVYVDNFQPSTTGGGGDDDGGDDDDNNSGECENNLFTLDLQTDNYGSETSWQLNQSNTQVASGSGYANNSTYREDFCLADGNYQFTIEDSYGDGICCAHGEGYYRLSANASQFAEGGDFTSSEVVNFSLPLSGNGDGGGDGGNNNIPEGYYDAAAGLSGYNLKTALYGIIAGHNNQGYSALWTFYSANEIDRYYENDGSILDIYSENPSGSDPYTFSAGSDQCGNYSGEGQCYNREHSFPRSWFGGTVEPMNSDVHHIFASDGQVNAYRSSYPYGEVGSASTTSQNGSLLGSARSGLGYSGTVFEPIDEFKGDLARAYFYMATRYQNNIAQWQSNSSYADAALNGSSTQVFENWMLNLLKTWHQQDPVSEKEIDRNNAAYSYQGNRNPFVDHPEYVEQIWGS